MEIYSSRQIKFSPTRDETKEGDDSQPHIPAKILLKNPTWLFLMNCPTASCERLNPKKIKTL